MPDHNLSPVETCKVLITASEAYPAFERLFLAAEKEIWAGFRVFDLNTRLRSDEARAVGETWFDLFRHTLERGVDITLVVSDFDPVLAAEYHEASWKTAQQLAGVEEVAGQGRLAFRIAAHPARTGLIPRLLFHRKVAKRHARREKSEYTPGLGAAERSPLYDLMPATHHQKLAVFDRKTVYIGGIDLDERRFDTPDHDRPAGETWQDVQVIVTGPVATAAQAHLENFEAVAAGTAAPNRQADGFVRTISARRRLAPFHISPKTVVSEIEDAHLEAIAQARHLIYLETQFFRHLPLADALARAGASNKDLHLVLVLPAAPEDVAFKGNRGKDARMGEHLQASAVARVQDAFGARSLICCPAQPAAADTKGDRSTRAGAPIVYVHSKVSIFDQALALVTSANPNGRSFRFDTEAGVRLTNPTHVAQLQDRMFRHWMPDLALRPPQDAARLLSEWRKSTEENLHRPPQARASFLLPYDRETAEDFGENVSVVPNELVV